MTDTPTIRFGVPTSAPTSSTPTPPLRALAAWPSNRPLAALVSATPHERWGRVSILAEPEATHTIEWRGATAAAARDSLEDLQRTLTLHADEATGVWIAAFAYEWGGLFEPTSMPRHRAPPDNWPLAVLCWCPQPHIYSHAEERWLSAPPQCKVDAAGTAPAATHPARAEITHLEADHPRADFERSVARTVEYIRAGDIYQANIAQRFSARWRGSTRAIAYAAFEAGAPRYGAYLETPTHALASMSPELFLSVDRNGHVITRPIKGTRGENEGAAALADSEKDAAELHMIVDLMRNDLGRVCTAGTVRVDEARTIESHATIHHGVAEVSGTLVAGTTVTDLLRNAFPPGSVTGAPKVRAMQVIDELEPVARGPYCGAIGAISAQGITLNVGIRTICMHRDEPAATPSASGSGTLRYSAGCGIVADSVPAKEYEESLHKTAVMVHAAHALRPR